MNPSYNNSTPQGQPPIFSSNPAPTSPSPISSPNPVPSQPISSGDIVLTPSTPKKSQKPLVIGLIIIVLLALAAALFFILNPTQNQNSTQTESKISLEDAFNRYANYLIYGKQDSVAKIDFDQFLETYDLYNPETVYAETADFAELQTAEELYLTFSDAYEKSTLTETEQYFYYYLGCKTASISEEECATNLGAGYKNLYEPYSDDESELNALLEILDFRAAAMESLLNTYYDIYNIDSNVESESI